jgi:hypothetical protein
LYIQPLTGGPERNHPSLMQRMYNNLNSLGAIGLMPPSLAAI